ncbi:electron transport complex subunit G [Shewanella inventionis]|uniref:Ion-translocating oxidoreductase complex subunit G n=2 Tax=Shewanella inventionis TaxID=1738770 RepID=A0ABQ1IPR7_9GAMM|nr:electron transport complex subunit G [Shewanella inventionis]
MTINENPMIKNGLLLGLFALCCTGLVALVNALTQDTIALQQQKQLTETLTQVIPTALHDNALFEQCILVHSPELLGSDASLPAYLAYKNQQPVAIAIEAIAPDGYNGEMKLIIGVDNNGQVLGVRTLSHQETPGLGDKIELRKSDWVTHFSGKMFNNNPEQWKVKKDGGQFDQFTGATITPRAYVKAVAKALSFVEQNRQALYQSHVKCEGNHE